MKHVPLFRQDDAPRSDTAGGMDLTFATRQAASSLDASAGSFVCRQDSANHNGCSQPRVSLAEALRFVALPAFICALVLAACKTHAGEVVALSR